MAESIHLVECPRDAMQGWKNFISTEKKVDYLNSLLNVGFHTIDFGSFVSAKAIPQLADTKEVIEQIDWKNSKSKLLAIVANSRGAYDASAFPQIDYLGFPFSISPTFQMRNTNSTIEESLIRVGEIQEICIRTGKQLVIYISMGFGNPYGDMYNEEIAFSWIRRITALDIRIVSLADTVGLANAEQVNRMTLSVTKEFPNIETGVHLHSTAANWKEKIDAAYDAGCKRFDGAIKGIGGCPMANDELVGNMNTRWMVDYFQEKDLLKNIDARLLDAAEIKAETIFI